MGVWVPDLKSIDWAPYGTLLVGSVSDLIQFSIGPAQCVQRARPNHSLERISTPTGGFPQKTLTVRVLDRNKEC